MSAHDLSTDFEAVVLAVGADRARDTDVPGRSLRGIHRAMTYLRAANHECEGDGASSISARGKNVVIIGGGDTAADCSARCIAKRPLGDGIGLPRPTSGTPRSRSRPMAVVAAGPAHLAGG